MSIIIVSRLREFSMVLNLDVFDCWTGDVMEAEEMDEG
jgi:hypothetical protein